MAAITLGVSTVSLGTVIPWAVIQDFLLSFTFAELLLVCLFAWKKVSLL